jgi:trans-2,3-dihydro-3-hydroxyanthranilate isomerase
MRSYRFTQVDVFAEAPFAGNPLAVFTDAAGLTDREMQAVALEMNLSETTFVETPHGVGAGRGDVRVRIFTPLSELPFAGHPSVGTACEVVRLGMVATVEPVTTVVLELGVGLTPVDVEVRDGVPVAATVHQGPPRFGPEIPVGEAARVLGLAVEEVGAEASSAGRARLLPQVVGTGLEYAVIPLRDTSVLARVQLDIERLPGFEHAYAEVYPFAFTGEDRPWIEARGLFPFEGIPEDPATGSAAGPLAAYVAAAGLLPPGETRVVLQGRHVGRPSHLSVSVRGAADAPDDVLVGGGVVPMLSGELRL